MTEKDQKSAEKSGEKKSQWLVGEELQLYVKLGVIGAILILFWSACNLMVGLALEGVKFNDRVRVEKVKHDLNLKVHSTKWELDRKWKEKVAQNKELVSQKKTDLSSHYKDKYTRQEQELKKFKAKAAAFDKMLKTLQQVEKAG